MAKKITNLVVVIAKGYIPCLLLLIITIFVVDAKTTITVAVFAKTIAILVVKIYHHCCYCFKEISPLLLLLKNI